MSAAEAIRRVYPSVLAKLLAFAGRLADAEDAVHDAVTRALEAWSHALPDAPEAWLVTVARNAHRDRLRRVRRSDRHAPEVLARLSPADNIVVASAYEDELLRLVFVCCHPSLEVGESAALALATVVGLSNDEVARAFVVPPRTMEQRLARARKRLREHGDPDGATPERSRERLPAVLRTLHLLFNEGYWSADDDAPIRADLCRLALGLASSLATMYPDEPEPAGLRALLGLHEARRAARLDGAGEPVPLPDQDRTRWDHAAIRSASALLEAALAQGRPGPMQLEAAIAAAHCRAHVAADTDWPQIAALYALLEGHRPTSAVRVSRAFAEGRAHGARRGLALLERGDIDVASYPYVHLVRGALLAECGEAEAADASFSLAAAHARNGHERRQIERLRAWISIAPGS